MDSVVTLRNPVHISGVQQSTNQPGTASMFLLLHGESHMKVSLPLRVSERKSMERKLAFGHEPFSLQWESKRPETTAFAASG